MSDKMQLLEDLRRRVAGVEPLPDEPDFFTSEETLMRYLKSRNWNLDDAERLLLDTIEYRRRTRPLLLDCSWCHNRPGFHSMRQIGHDEAGRPVIYSNFAQASTHKNTVDDTLAHVTYLIENATRTMPPGISTWIFIIDCSGMTMNSCNPKLGYGITNILSNHYPERLGQVICVNHSPVFHGVWKAIKQFLHPQTVSKVKLIRSKTKLSDHFSKLFSPELSTWLQEEITLNKQKPLPKNQIEFWNPPPKDSKAHDPRGSPSYVAQYLDHFRSQFKSASSECSSGCIPPITLHKPHPNVVDSLMGQVVRAVSLTPEELQEREQAQKIAEANSLAAANGNNLATENDEDLLGANVDELDIPESFMIPPNSLSLDSPS